MNQAFNDELDQDNQSNLATAEKMRSETEHKKELMDILDHVNAVGMSVTKAINSKSDAVMVKNFPTSISTPDVEALAQEMKAMHEEMCKEKPVDTTVPELLGKLLVSVEALPTEVPVMPDIPDTISITNQKDYDTKFDAVVKAVNAIKTEFKPNITVKPADVKIDQLDTTNLEKKVDILTVAVKAISLVVPEQDDKKILEKLSGVTKAINSLSFPVPNYILPFKKADGSATQALVDDDGKLNIDIDMATEGIATEATLAKTIPGAPTVFSGSVGTTPTTTITPATPTKSILLENTHATQNILISFDAGSNWKTVGPKGVYSIDCAVSSFQVKGSGDATTYEGTYLL